MTSANQISLRDIDEKFIEMNLDISLISIKKISCRWQLLYEKIFR